MTKQEVLAKIQAIGIAPVLRTNNKEDALALAEAIIAGGIGCLEVTMTVPGAVELIAELKLKFGDSVLIGAGTVLDEDTARECILAGAEFIVTPCLNIDVITFCNASEVLICAGALTPTEVYTAWRAGADVVKVFPVSAMGGASYLKALRAPFPDIKLMPTGGISLANAAEFIKAGAVAIGVGGEISNAAVLKEKGAAEISRIAREFRALVR